MPIHIIDQKISGGVYKELADGLRGGINDQGEFEVKEYLCDWSDRSTFMRELKGYTRMSGGVGGTWLTSPPYVLPDNPSLHAMDVNFEPEGELLAGYQPIRFSHAKFQVGFRLPDFNYSGADDPGFLNSISQDSDENGSLLYCTQELDFGREWLDVPNSSMKFKSDGKPINSPVSRSLTNVTMSLTWHHYPVMPMALIRGYADSVNNATFLGAQKGTVLFEGPRTVREATVGGTITQRVQFVFKWRQVDWNRSFREDSLNTYDYVVDKAYAGGPLGDSDAYTKFAYKDFSKLLLKR